MTFPVSSLDLRYVCRGLVRSPMFAVVTIVMLGLGIGANAAIFSLVDQQRVSSPCAFFARSNHEDSQC